MKIKLFIPILIFISCSSNATINSIEVDENILNNLENLETSESININSKNMPEKKSKQNQLAIERAAFDWGEIHKSNKDWNELMISLLNVRFNNHKQD